MARKLTVHPTDGELNILHVLWAQGPSRLSEICQALSGERQVALTTVATMLKIMSGKGQVQRINDGENNRWQAKLTRHEAGDTLLQRLVDRLFEGSTRNLVLSLIERGHLSQDDQREIKKLLQTAKQRKTNVKQR